MTAIVWFRRDLRVHDHPALRAAVDCDDRIVPVFCLDDRLLTGRHRSAPRTRFLLDSLGDLDRSLRERGSRLVVRSGRPERELAALARDCGAATVHVTTDVGPFARARDHRLAQELRAAGVKLEGHPGAFVLDDVAPLRTGSGGPYTTFSPFHRKWLEEPRRELAPTPRSLPPLPSRIAVGRLPAFASLDLGGDVEEPWPAGERPARERVTAFLSKGIAGYADAHDALSAAGTSRLSPYLHFGCLSPRELETRLPGGAGGEALRRQLCWRDFYAHVLIHHPGNAHSEHQQRYRGSLKWSRSMKQFDAWREGRTGYPLVDAAMRELLREGWMHNRARLVVGSFLTKDLAIDWRWGERWFMRMLIDGDEANNNGNWQWIASVGVDPQPPFRRIYNPARHQERYDPDGAYVRHNVPELRNVPSRYLAEPWTMPDDVQRSCECVIGDDYPAPIIDHAHARREALARYAAAR